MQPEFSIQNFIRFFEYVRITGRLKIPGRTIKSMKVLQNGSVIGIGAVNTPYPGLTDDSGFVASFTTPDFDHHSALISFELDEGNPFEVTGAAAAELYMNHLKADNQAERQFFERLKTAGYDRVLEIGSRARSGVIRRQWFDGKQYTGLDVLEGPNVDVVADAHVLSTKFAVESFDAVYSRSTLEHVAMPWKLALELNKVLRVGGIAYFETHQSLGMHDFPWDFWRFSDTAWNALFNEFTGFKVVEAYLGAPMALVPNIYHDHWKGYEGSVGFAASAVMVEKTGPSTLAWDLDVARAIRGIYPA